jgi:hypothetical protein
LSLPDIESVLKELSRYHATGFHLLNVESTFVDDFPVFDFDGWLSDNSEDGSRAVETLIGPVVQVKAL